METILASCLYDPKLKTKFYIPRFTHLGPTGHITGIDIAQPEYGSPYTVKESHDYAPRVYLCEYSYENSLEEQNVHALAAQTQRLFYRYRRPRAPGDLEQNVCAGLNQASILEAARGAGYRVIRDGKITPDPTFLEGHFEVQYVEGEKFMRRVKEEALTEALTEAQEGEVLASLARLREAHEEWKRAGHETVRNLDIWWAVLELGA
ncbi:hypothetical protein RU639_013510 [Aspergillus parasiticus]